MSNLWWYKSAADAHWATRVGNWWTNAAHNAQAPALPAAGDVLVFLGATGPDTGPATALANLSIDVSGMDDSASGSWTVGASFAFGDGCTFTGKSTGDGSNPGIVTLDDSAAVVTFGANCQFHSFSLQGPITSGATNEYRVGANAVVDGAYCIDPGFGKTTFADGVVFRGTGNIISDCTTSNVTIKGGRWESSGSWEWLNTGERITLGDGSGTTLVLTGSNIGLGDVFGQGVQSLAEISLRAITLQIAKPMTIYGTAGTWFTLVGLNSIKPLSQAAALSIANAASPTIGLAVNPALVLSRQPWGGPQ
jgi:hypothetical protein